MSNTVFIYVFYGAFSLIVIILILTLFKALQSVTRIDHTLMEMLKTIERYERRLEEKEMKRLP